MNHYYESASTLSKSSTHTSGYVHFMSRWLVGNGCHTAMSRMMGTSNHAVGWEAGAVQTSERKTSNVKKRCGCSVNCLTRSILFCIILHCTLYSETFLCVSLSYTGLALNCKIMGPIIIFLVNCNEANLGRGYRHLISARHDQTNGMPVEGKALLW